MTAVRSVVAAGNGAAIVHRMLAAGLPDYRVAEISPRVAAIPPWYRRAAAPHLAGAEVTHLIADYGPAPLSREDARVVAFHNFYLDADCARWASAAQRFYYRAVMSPAVHAAVAAADRLVVVSRFLADCVRTLAPRVPLEIVYNGIDTERFVPSPDAAGDRPLRVLFVGNPSSRKGFALLAAVASQLPPGVELAFTGGLRDTRVNALAARLISLGRVPYDEMPRAYQTADVLFFPTLREGFGLCVAEAMACGLPVVSTNCSAIPELVVDGCHGFLLAPDDVQGMVAALRRLLSEPSLRADLGAASRERARQRFALPRMLREYAEIFAMARRGRG